MMCSAYAKSLKLKRYGAGKYTTEDGAYVVLSDRDRASVAGKVLWFIYERGETAPLVLGETIQHETLHDVRAVLAQYIENTLRKP